MNRPAFYSAARPIFGGEMSHAHVDGCERIFAACHGLPVSWVAYLLATAYHETAATMQPVRETLAKTDADAVARLERAWKAGKLPWVKRPYWRLDTTGKSWFGRGYVQLTHRDNYAKASALVGVDLVADPSKAMQPEIAAKVLVQGCVQGLFTGKKLADYLPGDYVGARRVVNGTDKAALIAGYAARFEGALTVAEWGKQKPAPAKAPGWLAAIIAIIKAWRKK